jgi:ppGpp synthetase/RelA/SpoT-type nucleotidyltranferase
MALNRSAVDALGRRIAKSEVPTQVDLELLAQYRDEFREVATRVEHVLLDDLALRGGLFEACELTVTPRPAKTFSTLIDKLRRPGSNLSSIQDIAGFRIVGSLDMTLATQDRLSHAIAARFPNVKVDDRRLRPSWGYRAVHVIPAVDGRRVEIQIRTHLQDTWANAMESFGDLWGRWVRYGLPPEGPPEEIEFRVAVVEDHMRLSDLWFENENAVLRLVEARSLAAGGDASARHRVQELTDAIVPLFRETNEVIEKITARIEARANMP